VTPAAKKRLQVLSRWTLSATVLALLIHYVDLDTLLAHLRGLDADLVFIAFVLLVGEALVRCLNWQQLNRAAGCATRFGDVVYGYFTGGFFASVLPSTLGADAARSAFVARRSRSPIEKLLATTISLNLVSLLVLSFWALLGGVVLLIQHGTLSHTSLLSLAMGAGFVGLGACVFYFGLTKSVVHKARAAFGRMEEEATELLRKATARFTTAFLMTGAGPKDIVRVATTATATCALRTTGWLVLLQADGVYVPWTALLVLGPALTLAAFLPISVGGFGGLQAVSIYLLADWGVPAEQAVAWSLVQSGLYVILNSLGAVSYAAGGGSRAPEEITNPRGPDLRDSEESA
jgi:uncharacterized protein (TIRG00374 family)